TLEDEVDITRGDVIASSKSTPTMARLFDATVVWLNDQPLDLKKRYRLKHTTHQEWADIKKIHHVVNINTLDEEQAPTLEMNQIGSLRIETPRAIYFDSYRDNRITGSFILVDPVSNATVASGMITGTSRDGQAHHDLHKHPVTPGERVARWGHRGAVVELGN